MKHPVLTNKYGIDYLNSLLFCEFLGIEVTESNNRRKEQTVFLRWNNAHTSAVIVPTEDSQSNGCCVFGNLEYASVVIACERAGIKIQWKASNGWPLWPVWYTSPDKFAEFKKHYDSLIEKYS